MKLPVRASGGSFVAVAILLFCAPRGFSQEPPVGTAQGKTGSNSILKTEGGVPYYKAWLRQDVIWIISDEERAAFKLLKSDEERDQFIDAFWSRRDPTPDTLENEFKDEHYRRIVYANDHFGTRTPGWKSDRGRMYVMFGPPDEVESYPARAQDKTPGVNPSSYPLEVWHYRYLEGIGEDVVLEFVDACHCNEYNMPITPARQKDVRTYAAKGLSSLLEGEPESGDLRLPFGLVNPPKIRFKNLEEKLNAQLNWNTLPFEVSTAEVKATDVTSVVSITISFRKRDVMFAQKDGSRRARINIFGRVTTLTGRVVEVFEDTVDSSAGSEPVSDTEADTLVKTLALRNGRYKVEIAAQAANGDRWGIRVQEVKVGAP
jgi:GWxTD domain-containing protein